MACNENIIKNIANEVSRICQAQNCSVDPDFVAYMIDLLLLNPKYGKLFSKTINRSNLEYFVKECVEMLTRGEISINTLKIQHVIQTNYDKLQKLIDKHLDSIDNCLKPLLTEILEEDPDPSNESENKKLFRKISIYIILCSGLGNPGVISTLKEGMAALESVFTLDDLKIFVALPRPEKLAQLGELISIVSGVRLFNRDCKKGGETIPDLPFDLVDASKACLTTLSNSLITVMQRVNSLTSAIEESVVIQEETGNIMVDLPKDSDLTQKDYKKVFDLLAFNRQYEVFVRKLLSDVETMVQNGTLYVERFKQSLEELHGSVKYKAAVPVITVFPLFAKLWQVWRAMQNEMYLVSTVNKLMSILATLQDQMKIQYHILDKMLKGKDVVSDHERMSAQVSLQERLSLGSLRNYAAHDSDYVALRDRHLQYLGFCGLCLCVGALMPSNLKIGTIKSKGNRYGFCSVKMAARFSKDPERYINEVLNYARNNPQIINLLNIVDDVYRVKDIEKITTEHVPKTKVFDKPIQTEVHPMDRYIEKNYSWNLWEWKRRACQWASIVNCRTHSTQTVYSHLRSDVHCQTVEARDKCLQTKKDCGVNAIRPHKYLFGLSDIGDSQYLMDLTEPIDTAQKKPVKDFTTCDWPCIEAPNKEPLVQPDDEVQVMFQLEMRQ